MQLETVELMAGRVPPRQSASLSLHHDGSMARDPVQRLLDVDPPETVRVRRISWPGMGAGLLEREVRTSFRFREPVHLLLAQEHGSRSATETYLEGASAPGPRAIPGPLTLVPAGHEFRIWPNPADVLRLTYLYFTPAALHTYASIDAGRINLAPRLHFDDPIVRETSSKLKASIEHAAGDEDQAYAQAISILLLHELVRLTRPSRDAKAPFKGGLAAWQQKMLAAYIDEHLAEPISLGTMARLARLSPYHFSRAFSQSFGMPPHRYHTSRRIERAKALLAEPSVSITEVALKLGFSETSAFSATFHKVTGVTPSSFQRSINGASGSPVQ